MRPSARTLSPETPFRRITIVGVGLIGGSLGLAIRNRFPDAAVTGCDRRDVLAKALSRGAITIAEPNVRRAICTADLVILATPSTAIKRLLPVVASSCPPKTVVTDTGSVKEPIVREAKRWFSEGRFIGGHPMTGAEFSGIGAADPLLFENAYFILTPATTKGGRSRKALAEFYQALGARVLSMDAKTHDVVLSALSHVPQLLAVALVNAGASVSGDRWLRLGAGGFRDITRIASSPFGMWKDILEMNGKNASRSLGLLIRELQFYRKHLASNPKILAERFRRSARIRSAIPRGMKGFNQPPVEMTVYVKDRPGTLAEITRTIARAGVNIKDLELLKVREGMGGTFRLAFESEAAKKKAAAALRRIARTSD